MSKVAIITPCRQAGGINVCTALWLFRQRQAADWLPIESYSVALGRNLGVRRVLDEMPDVTHVMFVDSDVVPPDDAIERLLRHGLPIVSGVCPTVQPRSASDPALVIRAAVSIGEHDGGWCTYFHRLPRDLFECEFFGGAFFLVQRGVFEDIEWPWFKLVFGERGVLWPEDFWFCNVAKAYRYQLWCDPTVQAKHFHSMHITGMAAAGLNSAAIYERERAEMAERTVTQERDEAWLSDEACEGLKRELGDDL